MLREKYDPDNIFDDIDHPTHLYCACATAQAQCGKASKPTEFGHKVWLGEVDGGLISQYEILDGNPADEAKWTPTLQRHYEQFGHPPWLASADRGAHSASN